MNRYNFFAFLSGCIFCFFVFVSFAETIDSTSNPLKIFNLPQIVKAADVNSKVFVFAGEQIPLTMDAKERLDRELSVNSYYHSAMIQYLKLSNRYFPVIEKILLENGVPDDFKYLAVAESGLRHVTSSANAKGFWQFRKLAAKEMNLEVNDEVDERYHIERSTRAACHYLLQLKRRFGTWVDAAAAYNVGPTNYRNDLRDQKENTYYDMNLPEETMRYIFRLVAIKEIMSQPDRFGFYIDQMERYPPLDNYREVLVDQSIENWGDFAHENGVTYRQLKIYNLWLRDNHLTVIKNKYQIKIPNDVGK